jgi:hypothetical protein
MLMAEAFSKLLQVWERGDLSIIPAALIVDEITISLYQVLVRTLLAQNSNGSWGPSNSRETTAYAILTISKASVLPYAAPLQEKIEKSIAAAQEFILSTADTGPNYLWVEKVSYGSKTLAESYILAALNATFKQPLTLSSAEKLATTSKLEDIKRLYQTCFETPLFAAEESWKLHAAFIESCLYHPYLQQLAKDAKSHPENKTIEVISFVWTVYNYLEKQPLTTSTLRQKMSASLLEQLSSKVVKTIACNGSITNGKTNGAEHVNGNSSNVANGICREKNAYQRALKKPSGITHVPIELTYLLPDNHTGDLHNTFVQSSVTSSASINALLASAANSVFTSYDNSFAEIVGFDATSELIINRPDSGAFYELGAYIPPLNEVWFTSTFTK